MFKENLFKSKTLFPALQRDKQNKTRQISLTLKFLIYQIVLIILEQKHTLRWQSCCWVGSFSFPLLAMLVASWGHRHFLSGPVEKWSQPSSLHNRRFPGYLAKLTNMNYQWLVCGIWLSSSLINSNILVQETLVGCA